MENCLIDIARKVAFNSDLVQKHGSILIVDNQYYTGYNHFCNGKNNITIHAEEDAINNYIACCRKKYFDDSYIRRRLHKALLITIRVKKDSIKCSAPCRNCIELIKNYGIKQIIYSERDDEDNTFYIKKKSRDLENRPSSGFRWRERQALLCR
jgi:deoxycytidylate deaminase